MDPAFHGAIVEGQFEALKERITRDGWEGVKIERHGPVVFVHLEGRPGRAPARYLSRIDMSPYPIEPFRIGFIDPELPPEEWGRAYERDPRNWPHSSFAGLAGGFHISFAGPYRTFWCMPFTAEYFYYHGNEDVWSPSRWPLDAVVAHLRAAVEKAEHPDHWRPLRRPILEQMAQAKGIELPETAGGKDA